MNKLTTLIAVAGTATAMVLVLVGAPMVVQAAHVACGDFLVADTTLDADLICPGPGLHIAANNVTLDLGGHTLKGTGTEHIGVFNLGFDGVTIKNGTIDGFFIGVFATFGERDFTLTHLIFTGAAFDAVDMRNSTDVVIKHSSFIEPGGGVPGRDVAEAIHFESVDGFDVQNVDVHDYQRGVSFTSRPLEAPTNGRVRNSTFSTPGCGVCITNTTDAKVSGNHIIGSNIGILAEGGTAEGRAVSGVKIEDNFVHDNSVGIRLIMTSESKISGNHVRDNAVKGIILIDGSTDNQITSNMTSGNGVDLEHDASSTPNLWVGNSCEMKAGPDIPAC